MSIILILSVRLWYGADMCGITHLEVALDQISSDSRRETPCSSTVMRRAALSSSRADAPPNLRWTFTCQLQPHALR